MASRNELIDFFSGKSTNPPSKKSKPGPAKDQTEDGERISRTQYTEAGAKNILFSLGSWKWVQAETSKTLALSPVEMCQLRAAVTQFPTGNRYFVLAVAEYRMRNFQKAIDAATKVADAPNDGEARPRAELAILALSHLRLNNVEQANNYREQLNSLDERIRDEFPTSIFLENTNEESFLSWHREVNQLFDSRQDSDGGG